MHTTLMTQINHLALTACFPLPHAHNTILTDCHYRRTIGREHSSRDNSWMRKLYDSLFCRTVPFPDADGTVMVDNSKVLPISTKHECTYKAVVRQTDRSVGL